MIILYDYLGVHKSIFVLNNVYALYLGIFFLVCLILIGLNCLNIVENGAWIGLNELSNTKIHRWRWGYSTKLCGEFDWFGEEPEFHSNKDYHCGVMWQTYKYHWHLENCFTEHFYVCEMKLVRVFIHIFVQ